MAKKRKKKHFTGKNRHHLLYQARYWNNGRAKILRNTFVYMLDIKVHDELHNYVLRNVPKPSAEGITSIFNAFCEQRQEINQMGILEALEWLQNACGEEPYHSAMVKQTKFIKEKLG